MIKIIIPTTPERRDKLDRCLTLINNSICTEPFEVITEVSSNEGAVQPLKRLFEKVGDDDLVFFLTDDMFIESDVLQKLYDAYIREFPDSDGVVIADYCDAPFAHIKTFRKYWPLVYYHLYCDVEFFAIMRKKDKVYEVKNAQVHHAHYPNIGRDSNTIPEPDKTKQHVESYREQDMKLFEDRKAHNFYLDA